jgi:hypothetical protein
MAIFNSYVKLPEGIHEWIPLELKERSSLCKAAATKTEWAVAVFGWSAGQENCKMRRKLLTLH